MKKKTRSISKKGPPNAIAPDFVPANRYVDTGITAREREYMWPRVWHIVCREEELINVGSYTTYEIFNESIVVVRTSAKQIKAYYNVCQHRGRRLLAAGNGNTNGFFCKYHGWSYGLDGTVKNIPRQEEWAGCPGFKKDDLRLKEPRIDRWGGWIWVNMDSEAPPLKEWLGKKLTSTLAPFEFETLRRAWHEVIIAPVNWKVVVEAFNEGYHSGATHNHRIDYYPMRAPAEVHGNHARYFTLFDSLPRAKREDGTWVQTTTMQEMLYFQSKEINETLFALVPNPMMKAMRRLRDETPPDMAPEALFTRLWELHKEELEATGAKWPAKLKPQDLATAGTSWHIFPNTIVLPAVDGVLWYRMRPYGDDPHQCIFDIWGLQRFPEGKEPKVKTHVTEGFEVFRGRNPFLEQDFDNMVAVDRGMESRGWSGARTNPVEEATTVHFHRMLDAYTKAPKRRASSR